MGKSKMIYLDDDIVFQLEKEENMSKLVNTVLAKHYNDQKNPYSDWSNDDIELERQRLEHLDQAWKIQHKLEMHGRRIQSYKLKE